MIGAIALIAPGPGWLIIFAGLGILASEFAWADKALMKTKMLAIKTAQRALPADTRKKRDLFNRGSRSCCDCNRRRYLLLPFRTVAIGRVISWPPSKSRSMVSRNQ